MALKKAGTLKRLDYFLEHWNAKKRLRSSKRRYIAEDAFDFLSLTRRWEEIVGKNLARMTIPLKNQGKCLVILSNHPTFSQQLSFMQRELIDKIVSTFPELKGKIEKVSFQVNEAFFQEKQKQFAHILKKKPHHLQSFHPQSPEYKKYAKEAAEIFGSIENEEIRNSMISLYIQLHITQKR